MIRKHIPNAITSLNLASGCIAIVFAFQGDYNKAAAFVALAAALDFFDGFAARMLQAYSPMGKELDSLADAISFGVAPAAMVFHFLSALCLATNSPSSLAGFALLIPIFSALRLARFNIDDRQTTSFIGLPTPANGLFWAYSVAGSFEYLLETAFDPMIVVGLIVLFSWLLTSNIPMFSLKFNHYKWFGNRLRYYFLLGCVLFIILLKVNGIPACIMWYIVLSVLSFVSQKKRA